MQMPQGWNKLYSTAGDLFNADSTKILLTYQALDLMKEMAEALNEVKASNAKASYILKKFEGWK